SPRIDQLPAKDGIAAGKSKTDAVMARQVRDLLRRAASFEITRGSYDDHQLVPAQGQAHHVTRYGVAEPDARIQAALDDVDNAIVEAQLQMDVRVSLAKASQMG